MRKYLLLFLTLGLSFSCLSSNIKAEEKKDTKAPTITYKVDEVNVIKNYIEEDKEEKNDATQVALKTKEAKEEVFEYEINVIMGSELDLSKYIEVEDNSKITNLTTFGKVNLEKEGAYALVAIAVDEAKNATSTKFRLNVVSKKDYKKLQEQKDERIRKAEEQARIKREKERQETIAKLASIGSNGDLSALAASMVGMPGDCYYIATLFLNSAFGGFSVDYGTPISASEARPGDMIFYQNGGLGTTHYAVYLGGNTALQGNMSGITRIGNVYLANASTPIFYRTNH